MAFGGPLAAFSNAAAQAKLRGREQQAETVRNLVNQGIEAQRYLETKPQREQLMQAQKAQAIQQQISSTLGNVEKLIKLGAEARNPELLRAAQTLIQSDDYLGKLPSMAGVEFELGEAGNLEISADSPAELQKLISLAEDELTARGEKEGIKTIGGVEYKIISSEEKARRLARASAEARSPFQEKQAARTRDTQRSMADYQAEIRKEERREKFNRDSVKSKRASQALGRILKTSVKNGKLDKNLYGTPKALTEKLLGKGRAGSLSTFIQDALSIEILARSGVAVNKEEYTRLKRAFSPGLRRY